MNKQILRGSVIAATLLFICSVAMASTTKHGAALPAGDAVSLSKVLTNPDAFADKALLVEGLVKSVCTKKGCWMEVAASKDAKAPSCRVTFKISSWRKLSKFVPNHLLVNCYRYKFLSIIDAKCQTNKLW